jgi:hypothetical protein
MTSNDVASAVLGLLAKGGKHRATGIAHLLHAAQPNATTSWCCTMTLATN